jgi:hypothetical protein
MIVEDEVVSSHSRMELFPDALDDMYEKVYHDMDGHHRSVGVH